MGVAGSRGIKILAVDDNSEALFALEQVLVSNGYDVVTAQSGTETLAQVEKEHPDLILLDVVMPEPNGYEVTRRLKADPVFKYIPVVLLTSKDSLDDILTGFEHGADDYIKKPFKKQELLARMNSVIRTRGLYKALERSEEENRALREAASGSYSFSDIIGRSQPMKQVFDLIERVGASDVPVLILGESGTGKELVARAIHSNSHRASGPFVTVNSSAFNENLLESELFGHVKGAFTGAVSDKPGLFETANGGTFFLDELGEMSPALQVKLLRVLQDGTYMPVGSTTQKKTDARIVAATNRNIEKMLEDGSFREDLYYRLSVVTIDLPPLRDRRGDIPLLVEHFLAAFARNRGIESYSITGEALDLFMRHEWPGNIRELENEVERATVMAGQQTKIEAALLSPKLLGQDSDPDTDTDQPQTIKAATARLEKKMIRAALKANGWNKSQAAKVLGISRSSLITKVQQHDIVPE